MKTQSLKKNAISGWFAFGVNVLIGFLITPFIIRELGKTGYGIWTLVGSFVGYYGLLNLGVGSAVLRYIARYNAQGRHEKLCEVVNTALAMFLATGGMAICAGFLLAPLAVDFFEVSQGERDDFVHLMWAVGAAAGVSFPGSVLGAVVKAREFYLPVNGLMIVQSIARAVLIVVLVRAGWGVAGVGVASLFVSCIGFVGAFWLFRKHAGDLVLGRRYVKGKMLRVLVTYGGITTIIVVADILRTQLDSFVIGKSVGLEAVGVYGVAALLIRHMSGAISVGLTVLSPRFAALDGLGDHKKLHALFLRSLRISSFLGCIVCCMAAVFGPRFIGLWVGPGYEQSSTVLLILLSSYVFAFSQNPAIPLLYALNEHRYYAAFTIFEGILNLSISLLLVESYGIVGVALGTMISMTLVKVLVMPIFVCQVIKLSIVTYYSKFIYPFAVGGVLVFIVYLFDLDAALMEMGILEYVSCAIGCALIYAALMTPTIKMVFKP